MRSEAAQCDGEGLRRMFTAATAWLERHSAEVNSLNVFPVPDGDTGTNMSLTMRATMQSVREMRKTAAWAVAEAMAQGALMGARGNSGVILSQILRGLAQGLEGKHAFNGSDWAVALQEASTRAYKGVSKPVEGTMLTVIRDVSRSTQEAAREGNDLASVLERAVAEAEASVARTPSLLPILREAGVVDAGGQGLFFLLEGILLYLRGELEPVLSPHFEALEAAPRLVAYARLPAGGEPTLYGFCTEFLLQGNSLDLDAIREQMGQLGDSVLVVGDEGMVRVHLHTFRPEDAIAFVSPLGSLSQVKVQNMQEQHEGFVAERVAPLQLGDTSVVAVVIGEGLAHVFRSLGAVALLQGGDTSNPSIQELLQAVESSPCDKVLLLPNNPNVIPAAEQAASLSPKTVKVVPTLSIPQGLAALLAFNYEAEFERNVRAMKEATKAVHTAEVTCAVRSMEFRGLSVNEGQVVGLLDGILMAAGDSYEGVIDQILEGLGRCELITLYYGAGLDRSRAETTARHLRLHWPDTQVELVYGGQPHYYYIISIE